MAVPSIPALVAEHAEEAAYAWEQRVHGLASPIETRADVMVFDRWIVAHLDGLRAHDGAGWALASRGLEEASAGAVFVAAVLAAEQRDPAVWAGVIAALGTRTGVRRAVVSALGWLPLATAWPVIGGLLTGTDPLQQRIGIAACAAHRHDPGRLLDSLLGSPHPEVCVRALRAAGELGRHDLVPVISRFVTADHLPSRHAAAWSTAFLTGQVASIRCLQALLTSGSVADERTVQVAARYTSVDDAIAWLNRCAASSATRRLAIRIAGAIGDVRVVPWLINTTQDPTLAGLAGEAIVAITGVDLTEESLTSEPVTIEEDGDEPDPDADLPLADSGRLHGWWQARSATMESAVRYVRGEPVSTAALQHALRTAPNRQRIGLALELAKQADAPGLVNIAERTVT